MTTAAGARSPGTVQFVVPATIDDPRRPSGGNRYNRRVGEELTGLGWSVRECQIPGAWPHPDRTARAALAAALDALDGVVLVDGMVASAAGDLVAAAAQTRPVVVLVHMPFGPVEPGLLDGERSMLSRVAAVVTTSRWARGFLVDTYGLAGDWVHVASPGTDPARPAPRPVADYGDEVTGTRLLCVAAVTRAKGHDVLLAALSVLYDRPWQCTCVGSLDVDPAFAARLGEKIRDPGWSGRLRFSGPLTGTALDAAYAAADLLVLPSRTETWGMVVPEALARATPVVASDVGGIPEALGHAPDGTRPGLLVPPGDPGALARALRRWWDDPALRDRLRDAAWARRRVLPGWDQTGAQLATVLSAAAAQRVAGAAGKASFPS